MLCASVVWYCYEGIKGYEYDEQITGMIKYMS